MIAIMSQTALLLSIVCCVALRSSFGNSYRHFRKVISSSTLTIVEEIKPLRPPRFDTLRLRDTEFCNETHTMLNNVQNVQVSDTTNDDSSN